MAEGGGRDSQPGTAYDEPRSAMTAMDGSLQDVRCSVLISNIDESVTNELLLNFIESKYEQLAIKNIERGDPEPEKAVVWFESPVDVADIQDVCEKTPLKGKVLRAEANFHTETDHAARQCREAVFSGMHFSDDHLINLLECKCPDCDVKEVLRGNKKDTAKAVFEDPVDLIELEKTCKSNLVDGRELKVLPADERGAVLVLNPHPETKTNSFDFYFKNTRRSDGGKVLHLDRDEEHNKYLIVYFETKEVAERVAKRRHTLENQELQLKLFDLDLDDPPIVDDGKCDVTSTSLSVPQASDSSLGAASADVAPEHPEKSSDSDRGHEHETRKIATNLEHMSLQEKTQEKEKKPMEIKKTVKGLHDVYVYILDAFSELIADEFHITITTGETLVMIEGEERDVEKVEQLLSILLERQGSSQYITEVADRFNGWEDIFTDIEKRIADGGHYYLVLRECLAAGSAAEELCIGLLSSEDNSGPMTFDQFLRMYVNKSEVPVKSEAARDLLSTTIAFNEFVVTKIEEIYGPRIQMFLDEFHEQIILLGPPELLEDAADDVERFLEEKSDQQTIDLNSKQRDFLNDFCSTELESLQRGTGLKYAQIQIKESVCEIQGCRAGVTNAAKSLKDIIKKLCCRRAIFTHPNLASMLQSRKEMWDPMVGRVSQENCCIITELPDPRFQDADNDNDEWGQWTATVINSFPLPGGQVIVHVTDGNAEDLKVDAAVLCYNGQSVQSSTNRQKPQPTQAFVQNTGARPKDDVNSSREHRPFSQNADQSTHLLLCARPKNHGNSSNRDGRQLSDQPRGINVTQSGALPCKAVIHVDLSHYFSEGSSAAFDSALQALMTDIFQECDRHHFSSLALPVFGVDVRASHDPQPVGEATEVIAMCCCNALALEGKNSSVRDVFLCSGRAACLHGLTFALEDQHGPSLPKLSPFPETFQRLSCQPIGSRHTPPNTISVSMGDISRSKADVLIVPLDIDIGLDLDKSKVTRSLVMNGGKSVQFSIQHRTTSYWTTVKCIDDNNEVLADQHLLVGNPGYLNAKHIFYVYIPPWGPGVIKMLRERVQKCLRKAAEKGCKTVAMTALGVGKLGYPVEFAARTSIAAVADFMDQRKASLENVNFVMLPADKACFRAFSAEHNEWQKHQVPVDDGDRLPPLEYPHHTEGSSGSQHSSFKSYAQAAGGRGRGNRRGRGNERGKGNERGRGRGNNSSYSQGQSPELMYSNPYTHKSEKSCFFKIGKIKLSVKQGNILFEKCDILINSINVDFDFDRGGVAKAFKRHCGDELLKTCNEKANKKKMRKKGFVMTSAPRPLQCKHILHVDLGKYVDKPKDTIKECVKQVQEKKMSSVAFPALGTGESTNNGPEELAQHMVDAIKEIKDPKKLEEVRIVMSSRRLFVRLVEKVDALLLPAGNPSGKSKPEKDKQQAATASAKSADRSAMSRPPQTSPPPSLPPQEWESVCHRGHSLDPTRQDAVSLFIFSDSEERRQAAVEEIAIGIVRLLGPGETEEPMKKVAGEGRKRGDDGQGNHSGGSLYSWDWGLGHCMPYFY